MPDWTAILQSKVGVIDLRERSAFDERHVRQSLHVAGIPGLLDRFSWLPPPKTSDNKGLQLIAICKKDDEKELRKRLNRWNLGAIIDEDDEDFWRQAGVHGLVVSDGQLDLPNLLFVPSAIVNLALQACEEGKERQSICKVLDLGCGAGRDIAWIVRRKSKMTWLATGLDNLHATIQRAELLRRDMQLDNTQGSHIERLVWAQATDHGTLEALRFGPTSKSKGIAVERDSKEDDSLQSFANIHLPHQTYDLILLVRFLPRPLLANLPLLSHSKTIIAISHFTTINDEIDYSSPDSSKRFEVADVNAFIEQWGALQWRLLDQIIHRAEDGRPIRSALFQRV